MKKRGLTVSWRTLEKNRKRGQRVGGINYQSCVPGFLVYNSRESGLMKNIIVTIAAFILFASSAFAQGSIEGTITDAKGAVVGSAVVSLIDAKGANVARYTTDAEGYYTLDDVAAGTYKLVVNAGGFKPATKTNVLVVDDGLTVVDLTLVVAPKAGSVVTANPWPQPKFGFSVEYTVGGKTSRFNVQDVAGLDAEEPIYRAENKATNAPPNLPGLKDHGDITLKKAVFVKDLVFFEWHRQVVQGNAFVRGTVVINLLDEKGGTTMSWTLTNAFPKTITGINQATGSVETITIAHQGMTIANP